jgi:hypothetical protein
MNSIAVADNGKRLSSREGRYCSKGRTGAEESKEPPSGNSESSRLYRATTTLFEQRSIAQKIEVKP